MASPSSQGSSRSMSHTVLRIVTFSALLSLVQSVFAESFDAPMAHSSWKTSGSKLECTLSHTIPGYGSATFSQSSGGHQSFILQSILGRLQPGYAKIIVSLPRWQYNNQSLLLGKIPVSLGQTPIKLSSITVYQLLESLARGRTPAFVMTPANTAGNLRSLSQDKIVLSAIGFQKPYKEYLNCISEMITHPFSNLKESVLYFESGSSILSNENEARLKELADFIRTDGKIRKISLEGYSDSKGNYQANVQLSYERMWAVKDFMVMHYGISPKMVNMKDFADKGPVATNKTAEGRAKNRRVVIKLYR